MLIRKIKISVLRCKLNAMIFYTELTISNHCVSYDQYIMLPLKEILWEVANVDVQYQLLIVPNCGRLVFHYYYIADNINW